MDGPLGLFSRLIFATHNVYIETYLLLLKFKIGLVGQNAESAMRSMRWTNKSTKSSTNYKKFEFENSDFGFQSFACPARGSKVEIYISTYGFCCNPYTSPKHT